MRNAPAVATLGAIFGALHIISHVLAPAPSILLDIVGALVAGAFAFRRRGR